MKRNENRNRASQQKMLTVCLSVCVMFSYCFSVLAKSWWGRKKTGWCALGTQYSFKINAVRIRLRVSTTQKHQTNEDG